MNAILRISGLCGGYDPVQIFDGVDLTVSAGESIGLFGPNGHGKTTLLKTISGLIDPWRGEVRFKGERLNLTGDRGSRRLRNFNYDVVTRRRMDPRKVARAGLIHVPQGNLLFPEMTVEETLDVAKTAAKSRAESGWSLDQIDFLFPRLRERWGYKVRFLSGGERQMVSIAAGLLSGPELLILDEPTLGLSPQLRETLCKSVIAIRETGLPIILVDQDVSFLGQIIDTLYLFDHGRLSGGIPRAEMPSHDDLMEQLFGKSK